MMKTIIPHIQIKAITSWLPTNTIEMISFNSLYGESEVRNIIRTTGVERVRVADKEMTSADMCQKLRSI